MVFDELQGRRLSLAVGLVGAMGFMLQGYDQAVANGLLTLDSFVKTFPAIDAIHATGAEKSHKSTIQGTLPVCNQRSRIAKSNLSARYDCRNLRSRLCYWSTLVCLSR
jgi:hypothetical protein